MKPILATATALVMAALPALAEPSIEVEDAYVRVSTPMAQSGAAFMVIANHGESDDRLVAAHSDIAARVELHTHVEDAEGIMRMIELEAGAMIPAGQRYAMERGGDHVMFMGLTRGLSHGDDVALTLEFEHSGRIDLIVPVDLERAPSPGANHGHGHNHGD